MKVIDLTPRMIGQHIRITGDRIEVEGQLLNFELTTTDYPSHQHLLPGRIDVKGVTVELDHITYEFKGGAEVAIIKDPKTVERTVYEM